MNLEQRAKRMEDIRKAEGLLAYAVSHGDEAEADRLRAEPWPSPSGMKSPLAGMRSENGSLLMATNDFLGTCGPSAHGGRTC